MTDLEKALEQKRITPKGVLVVELTKLGVSLEDAMSVWESLKGFCEASTVEYANPKEISVPCLVFSGGGKCMRVVIGDVEQPEEKKSVIIH